MPTIETKIMQAIKARVATIPLSYDKLWTDGEPASPPTTGGQPAPYVECHFEPNRNVRRFTGAKEASERPGLLLLTLCWPIAKVGAGSGKTHQDAIREMAASKVAAHFGTDNLLSFQGARVRVTNLPDVLGSYRDDAYLRVPCTVTLQAFT